MAYNLMIVTFAFSTLMSFWCLMSLEASIISTIVFAISCYFTYFFAMRIYRKLRFEAADMLLGVSRSSAGSVDIRQFDDDTDILSRDSMDKCGRTRVSLTRLMRSSFTSSKPKSTSQLNSAFLPKQQRGISIQGYLDKLYSDGTWKHVYFVLTRRGALYFYNSRRSFNSNRGKPINRAAIELCDYDINSGSSVSPSATSSSQPQDDMSELQIHLVPRYLDDRDRTFILRCDSLEQLGVWKMAFIEAALLDRD